MVRAPAGNPEWIDWLAEERDKIEAKQPENKFIQGLNRAIKELKSNPVRMSEPHEASTIKFIGPKIIGILEKYEKKQANGDDSDDEPRPKKKAPAAKAKAKAAAAVSSEEEQLDDDFDVLNPKATRKAIKGKAPAPKPKKIKRSSAANALTMASLRSSDNEEDPVEAKKKKRPAASLDKEKKEKAYMPKLNSCPFAILIALYIACGEDEENWRGVGLTKEQLAKKGQKFTSTDMMTNVKPTAKANFGYSGVSSIKTLVEKGLMVKKGRAPVYHYLTGKGVVAGRKCAEEKGEDLWALPGDLDEESEEERPKKKAKTASKDKGKGKAKAVESENEEEARPVPKKQPRASTSRVPAAAAVEEDSNDEEAPFTFVFIDDGGDRTLDREEAESTMSSKDGTTLVKIEFRSAQSRHTLAKYIEQKQRNHVSQPGPEGLTEYGFIPRKKVAVKAFGFPSKKAPRESAGVKEKAVADLMGGQKKKAAVDPAAMYKMPSQARSSDAPKDREPSSAAHSFANNTDEEAEQIERVKRASAADARRKREMASRPAAMDVDEDLEIAPVPKPKAKAAEPPRAGPSNSNKAAETASLGAARPAFARHISNVVGPPFIPFDTTKAAVMRPGDFTVKICYDHREKQYAPYFNDKAGAVKCELALGDIVWVACRKVPSGIPENDTIVLDAVVERKTLPDLVDSVKHHRYEDQKRRMKKCGMTRLYYLIENGNKADVKGYEQMVWTVKSQTQILDGFICHNFDGVGDAVKHLKRMTKIMAEIYEGKTIHGIPSHATSRVMYLKQLDDLKVRRPGSEFLPTLDTWNQNNGKVHTIGTNWSSMLYSTNGLSAEKVCAIVERWPTAQAFISDVSKRKREEEASGETAGPSKRAKTGSAASYIKDEVGKGSKRDIGMALSQQLYEIWTQSEYA